MATPASVVKSASVAAPKKGEMVREIVQASPGDRLNRKLKGAFNAVKTARILYNEMGENDDATSLVEVEAQLYGMKVRAEKFASKGSKK